MKTAFDMTDSLGLQNPNPALSRAVLTEEVRSEALLYKQAHSQGINIVDEISGH